MDNKLLITIVFSTIILINSNISPALDNESHLSPCVVKTHCAFRSLQVSDIDKFLDKITNSIENTSRTKITKKDSTYIHAEAKSKIMHYIDDLEIKALRDEGIIEIRSESRVGIGDFGVNGKRIDDLIYRLSTNK